MDNKNKLIETEEKYRMLERNRNNKQEELIRFLKLNLSNEQFNIAYDYIEDLEKICNTIIGLLKK